MRCLSMTEGRSEIFKNFYSGIARPEIFDSQTSDAGQLKTRDDTWGEGGRVGGIVTPE